MYYKYTSSRLIYSLQLKQFLRKKLSSSFSFNNRYRYQPFTIDRSIDSASIKLRKYPSNKFSFKTSIDNSTFSSPRENGATHHRWTDNDSIEGNIQVIGAAQQPPTRFHSRLESRVFRSWPSLDRIHSRWNACLESLLHRRSFRRSFLPRDTRTSGESRMHLASRFSPCVR